MRQNRRKFIQLAASATTALLTTSMELFALTHKPTFSMNNKFELMIMATNWGFPGSLDEYCEKAKKEGYDGIEIWWPLEKEKQDELFRALKNHGLAVGFLCAGSDSNYEKHFDQFVKNLCILIVIPGGIILVLNKIKDL
jgi:tryptophan synthase alpha subunit